MKTRYAFLVIVFIFRIIIVVGQNYSIDTTFHPDYAFRYFYIPEENGSVAKVSELEDGSVYIGGSFSDPNDFLYRKTLIKVDESGNTDLTFCFQGWPNGLRSFYIYDNYVYVNNGTTIGKRYLETADPVVEYYDNVVQSDWGGSWTDLYVFDNGDFLIAGSNVYHSLEPDERRTYISKINSNGFYDTTFFHQPNNHVTKIIRYDNERLIIGGTFNSYDSIPIIQIGRIFNDGTLDTTFHSIFEGYGGAKPLYVQDDGKIIIGGLFHIENVNYYLGMVRLNQDGSLDTTFNNFNNTQSANGLMQNEPWDEDVYETLTICPTTNGKYLLGGSFPNYQGIPRGRIALIDYNGFLDTSTFSGSGFKYDNKSVFGVRTIRQTANNKFFVGGYFNVFNDEMVEPIIRIHGHTYNIDETANTNLAINIFPNPASDIINIDFGKTISTKTQVNLYSIRGELVKEMNFIGNDKFNFSLKGLTSGIYICKFTGSKFTMQKKIIIVN